MTTTTKKKKLTAKQLQTKAQSLLRGIDNSAASIASHQKKINTAIPELNRTLTALGNADSGKPAKPIVAAKAAKPAKKPAAKPAKKPVAAKPAKKPAAAKKAAEAKKPAAKPAAKPAKKPATAKKAAESKAEAKPTDPNRPSLRDATKEFLKGGKRVARADLYKSVTGKYGYWSRQSFYTILKDENEFSVDKAGNVALKVSKTSDKDAEAFVKSVQKDPSVSQAV